MGSSSSADLAAVLRRRPLSISTARNNNMSTLVAAGEEKEEKRRRHEGETTAADEPLSPAARLFHQPRFNCYIVTEIGLAKPIDVDAVKAGLQSTLIRHPRFSSAQVLDEPGGKKSRWVRTKVNVDDHIVTPDLNPSGSPNPDQLVEDYVSALTQPPAAGLDPSRPMWDLHVINTSTSRAAAVAVLRAHHSLGDGISLMSLLLACTRKVSDPTSPPSIPASRRQSEPRRWGLLAAVWTALVLLWHTFIDMMVFMATACFLKDSATPLRGEADVEFRPKRFVHRAVSLEDVKAVKKAVGCTVNDVLLGITSLALTRYLSRKCENAGEKNKSGLPRNMRIRSTLLVNIRQRPGILDLAGMMEEDKCNPEWGNWLGYLILPFPVVLRDDPLDYVRKGKAIADRKKNSLEAILTYRSAYLIVKLLGMKIAAALCHRVLRNTTFSFSNIVGPSEEIEFYGHPMVYIAPSVYGHPNALTVHFQSYKNEMEIVVAVDEQSIPDPHQLLDDLAESVRIIKDAVDLERTQQV